MAPRLFLAVPVRLERYAEVRALYGSTLQGRWRDAATLHVTVAFLGNAYTVPGLIETLGAFDWAFAPSELDTLDYFTRSRVFVATTENPSLQRLRERLETCLGLPSERLRPHATLMRVKRIEEDDLFRASLPRTFSPSLGVLEPKVALYESTLIPEGARYTVRQEWPA